ncbi:unnamed protein product [Moneuplotes crassus]|uniref:BZIP domain-containing protein n=1 Tax=Euplotes crassus TaxID=5936 RepID=A0AAD2D065_EUPCR|nr:unnamed protein product [Moneuplotes crassus]
MEEKSRKKGPKSGKERSKEFRERQKRYHKTQTEQIRRLQERNFELEAKNKQLVKENSDLKKDIKDLKENILGTSYVKPCDIDKPQHNPKFDHPLHEYEDFMYNHLAQKLQKNPEEVRFSTWEQTREKVANYSDERIDYLKKRFNDILDNMLNLHSKTYQALNRKITIKNYLKKTKIKKRYKKGLDKTSELPDPEDVYLDCQFSTENLEFVKRNQDYLMKYMKQIKKIAQSLVVLRNKLLNIYSEEKRMYHNPEFNYDYKKSDLASKFKVIATLKHSCLLSPHYIFDIPKKIHSGSTYQEGELTD